MVATAERPEIVTIKPAYHNLGNRIETTLPQEIFAANGNFRNLVELLKQSFERSHIQVYENGDQPCIPSNKPERRYFTLDPLTGQRLDEVKNPKAETRKIPAHINSEDGVIYFKQAARETRKPTGGTRKWVEYWQTDINGVPQRGDNGEIRIVNVAPALTKPERWVHKQTNLEVKGFTELDMVAEEIADIAAFHFQDLIEHPETPGAPKEWANAAEIAPAMIGFLTDRSAYVEGVQKSHALNIVSAALQIARNPDTKVKIVSGFGASDQEASNAYVGNALPALLVADNIRRFFEGRQKEGKKGLTYAPVVELVFAQEAGIEANFDDKADQVRTGMAQKMELVRNFAATLFPDIPVVLNQDNRWSKLSPQTMAIIRYYANLIQHSPSESVQETLDELVSFGHTKGTNGSTKETAARYSAIHPLVWGLKPNYVPTQYLQQEIPADVTVRIGPRTEAKFDAMIMAVRQGENREGFIQHVLDETQRGSLTTNVAEQIVKSANSYQPTETPIMILATGKIGEHGPTYFTYDYDWPAKDPVAESIRRLQEKAADIIDSDLASVTRRTILLARAYDLEAISRARQRLAVA